MRTRLGSVIWRLPDGSEFAATLFDDGTWRVEPPSAASWEKTLAVLFADPEWDGATKLRHLANVLGDGARVVLHDLPPVREGVVE